MKAKELYGMQPQRVEKDLGYLKGFNYDHIAELSNRKEFDSFYGLENEKVEIKYYADYCYDGRRTWTLASVWFEESPVMIIQNAGREGDDHEERFITNEKLYKKMLDYIESLIDDEEIVLYDLIDENEDLEDIDNFYGDSLSNLYNPNLKPKYKVGDIVEATVALKKDYGYIFDTTPMIKKKVKITRVDPVNPYDTYGAVEVERHIVGKWNWETKEDTREIVDKLEGVEGTTMNCWLNESLVQIR